VRKDTSATQKPRSAEPGRAHPQDLPVLPGKKQRVDRRGHSRRKGESEENPSRGERSGHGRVRVQSAPQEKMECCQPRQDPAALETRTALFYLFHFLFVENYYAYFFSPQSYFHFLFVKKESGERKSPRRLALRQIYRFLAKITGTTGSRKG